MYIYLWYVQISANTLVVISVFRYIIICKPQSSKFGLWKVDLVWISALFFIWFFFRSEHRLTPRLSCICIAGTVFYALIWTLSPFFGWSSYTHEPFGASCSFDWYNYQIPSTPVFGRIQNAPQFRKLNDSLSTWLHNFQVRPEHWWNQLRDW